MDITAYFAGPIDLVTSGRENRDIRQVFINHCKAENVNITIFNPAGAYKTTNYMPNINGGKYIELLNNQSIMAADIFVAYVPHDVPSIGTPIEIDLAHRCGKPLFVISTIPYGKSIYLTNKTDSELYVYYNPDASDTFDSAMDSLVSKINAWIKSETKTC